jgi:integrase
LNHLAGGDRTGLVDRLNPGKKPLSPVTVNCRRIQTFQLVSALVHKGHQPEQVHSLPYLIEHAEDAVRYFLDDVPQDEKSGQVANLAIALTQIAIFLGVDDGTLKKLRGWVSHLLPEQTDLTPKNRARLRQFDDQENVRSLINLPSRVVAEVAKNDRPTPADAIAVQMALAIALLLVKPVRARSLASINIKEHISRTRSAQGGIAHIAIPRHNVKNKRPIEFEVPDDVAELLALYLNRFHPLLAPNSPWLFPGEHGLHKQQGALGAQIKRFIFNRTGLTVNAHLFRHFAAKLVLEHRPGAYEDVRQLLSNKSHEVVVRHYSGSETRAADRLFENVVRNKKEAAEAFPVGRSRSGR